MCFRQETIDGDRDTVLIGPHNACYPVEVVGDSRVDAWHGGTAAQAERRHADQPIHRLVVYVRL